MYAGKVRFTYRPQSVSPSSFPHVLATTLILDIHASVVLNFAAVEQKWVSKKKRLESSRVTFPQEKKDKSPTEPIM